MSSALIRITGTNFYEHAQTSLQFSAICKVTAPWDRTFQIEYMLLHYLNMNVIIKDVINLQRGFIRRKPHVLCWPWALLSGERVGFIPNSQLQEAAKTCAALQRRVRQQRHLLIIKHTAPTQGRTFTVYSRQKHVWMYITTSRSGRLFLPHNKYKS